MKKIIITMLLTVCVMTGLGLFVIDNINQTHEITINELKNAYESEMKLSAKSMNDMDNLERNVYRMMNGEDYSITIEHNGETYTYESNDDNSIKTRIMNLVY